MKKKKKKKLKLIMYKPTINLIGGVGIMGPRTYVGS